MIVKKLADQNIVNASNCGTISEILTKEDKVGYGIAIIENVEITTAHYHNNADETYLVLNGSLTLSLYDPTTRKKWNQELKTNELCFIPKGIHHKISQKEANTKLCVICSPFYDADDDIQSTIEF